MNTLASFAAFVPASPSPPCLDSLKAFPSQSSLCRHSLPCLQRRLGSFSSWRTTMGIKGLSKLLSENAPRALTEQKFENYIGRKIAIDASISLYQFLIVLGRKGTDMLTNEAGEVTSHLQGMLTRTVRLLESGMKPVYVFDGQLAYLKKAVHAKRDARREEATEHLVTAVEAGDEAAIEKYSKRTVKVTQQHNKDCQKLLRLMGVPVVEAPSEAEAECASLCKSNKVYAVASEDMDSLTFGAPRFLRRLMEPTYRKVSVLEYNMSKVLEELQLNMNQFIDLCILCGCDYCDTIKGIGPKTALKLIHKNGDIETVLEKIKKSRYHIPDHWQYQEARYLFKEPFVTSLENQPDFQWTAPDEEGLKMFLVEGNSFNHDRVLKAVEKIEAARHKSS